jgi:AcrR family transcriptional regulator
MPTSTVPTPWGDAEQLRTQKLAPGYRLPQAEVRANQRARLLAAMVAVVAERGYDGAAVAPVVELSGVSRAAFYRLFESRADCFATAVEEAVGMAVTTVERARRGASGPSERLLSGLEALLEAVARQPAAATACLVDVYRAGPGPTARAESAKALFAPLVSDDLVELGLPRSPLLARAIVGGVAQVISTRLRAGRAAELPALAPALAAWIGSYARTPSDAADRLARSAPPPASNGRRPVPTATATATTTTADEAARTPVDRILAAVVAETAESGYAGLTSDVIAKRAAMSLSTFYRHFGTSDEAFLAVCAILDEELRAATRTAGCPAADWRPATATAIERALAHLAADPDRARIGIVDALELGASGLERRDRAIASWSDWLAGDPETGQRTTATAREATGGAVFALIYEEVRRGRTAQLGAVAGVAAVVATGFCGPADRGT